MRSCFQRRSVPEDVARALVSADPSLAGAATDIFLSASADLLERRASWLMEIDGLQRLNTQSQTAAVDLYANSGFVTSETQRETMDLLEETDARRESIVALRTKIRLAEAILAHRRVPYRKSSAMYTAPEHGTLDDCQFCFSSPPQVEFKCCGYKGACSQCVRRMLRDDVRCPHCRSDHVATRRLKK